MIYRSMASAFRMALLFSISLCLLTHAAVLSTSVNIRARYNVSCDIGSTSDADFGTIFSNSTALSAKFNVTANCSSGTQFIVWAPLNSNASGTQRRMVNSASTRNVLNYNVTLDATGAALPTSSAVTPQYTSDSTTTSLPIALTATIPLGQTLVQGYYSDTLMITVSY